MTVAELIEQLHDYDPGLIVYVETDSEISPVHSLDRDQFHEGDALRLEDLVQVSALLLVATELGTGEPK